MHRRSFLAALGAAAAAARSTAADRGAGVAPEPGEGTGAGTLRVLMLGGTGFLGPTLVQAFLDRGHRITLFNRGLTNPHLFRYLERLRGDREEPRGAGLGALQGRDWDIVIDTWQKGPQCVEDTARLLRGRARAYYYISSIAVYRSMADIDTTESAALRDVRAVPVTRGTEQPYALRKTLGERLLADRFDGITGILRSHGMRGERIASPDDEPYWPVRLWRGGEVLAPGDGQSFGQFTDTRSLARFLVGCAERGLAGPCNVMSAPFRLADFLGAAARVTGSPSRLVWVPRHRLAEFGIEPYRDLPMWRPEPAGFYRFSTARAVTAGLRHRPLSACIASMLEGFFARRPEGAFRFGAPGSGTLSAAREASVLQQIRS